MSTISRSVFASFALALSVPALGQSPSPVNANGGTVTGVVGDSSNVGIVGATVMIRGGTTVAVSADDGAFRLTGVPLGPQTLIARRIGFRPDTLAVTVRGDSAVTVRLRLRSSAQQVAPVIITAGRTRYTGRLAGFYERRERGNGRFFSAADIDRRQPRLVSDLLRTVPGVRVGTQNGQNIVTFRGRNCAPLVWLDGSPATAGYLDVDLFQPSTLAGIEIYSGQATVPAALTWLRGKSNCGVIALWTRLPEPRGKRPALLSVTEIEALVNSAELFTADSVDTPAAPEPSRPLVPVFPDSLLRAATNGRVVAEFVVDISGEPNMSTFSAVQSTHSMFTEAVRAAVSAARFTPAWRGGKRVRQLVQLPFSFTAPGKGP